MVCDICESLERQVRDCEQEVHRIIDDREHESGNSPIQEAASLSRLEQAVAALRDAEALSRYHSATPHPNGSSA